LTVIGESKRRRPYVGLLGKGTQLRKSPELIDSEVREGELNGKVFSFSDVFSPQTPSSCAAYGTSSLISYTFVQRAGMYAGDASSYSCHNNAYRKYICMRAFVRMRAHIIQLSGPTIAELLTTLANAAHIQHEHGR
jgi:hypothetical protein